MRLKRPAYLKTYMTFGGETDSSNPSRLIFSIKIPVSPRKETKFNIYSNVRTKRRDARSKKLLWAKKKQSSFFVQSLEIIQKDRNKPSWSSPLPWTSYDSDKPGRTFMARFVSASAISRSPILPPVNYKYISSSTSPHLEQYYRAHKKTYKYLKMFMLRKKAFNSRWVLHWKIP